MCLTIAPVAADLCSNGIPSASSAANLADLVLARQVALGTAPVSACPGLNDNGDQSVTVSEILGGISLVLQGAGADGGSAAGLLDPVFIDVGTAWGSADELVTFDVRLASSLGLVAGAQIDINFDPQTPIPPHENPLIAPAPFCDVNPAINKAQSAFAFTGPNSIRAVIVSFTNIDLIPEGAVLFTCHVHISALAAIGTYPLPCSNALSSTPGGLPLITTCAPGAVTVIEHAMIDHYKCYQGSDLKNPKFTKQSVITSDQLVSNDPLVALKLAYVCTPVDKNGEGIENPSAHLACYAVKALAVNAEPRLLVSTQFQATQFQVKKPKMLCVPATKTLLP